MNTLLLSLAVAGALPSVASAAQVPVLKAEDGCCKKMAKDKKVSCCEKMKKEAASKDVTDPHAGHDMSKM